MSPARAIAKVVKVSFDAEAIAFALRLPVSAVLAAFRDGRVASKFTEHWGALLFGYSVHSNSNNPGTDGLVTTGEFGLSGYSVKSLSRSGVRFQKSVYVGSGRKCTIDDLNNSLLSASHYLVVDISEFPLLRFVEVHPGWLVRCVSKGTLTPAGWTNPEFWERLRADYAIEEHEKELPSPAATAPTVASVGPIPPSS